jgi:hypothetical protein
MVARVPAPEPDQVPPWHRSRRPALAARRLVLGAPVGGTLHAIRAPEPARILKGHTIMKARHILDHFVRSEYFATWQSERIGSGGYSRYADRRDRYDRCYAAAEDGGDGSTHAEGLDDMRDAFSDWIRDRSRGRWGTLDRLESAVRAEVDAIEQWHAEHGSLYQEIG